MFLGFEKLASQSRFLLSVLGCVPIVLEEYFAPLLILTLRLWMLKVVFCAGVSRLSSLFGLFLLFLYEYSLPLLGSVLLTVLYISSNSFILALLIGLGFLSRIASFQILIVTTAVYLFYAYFVDYYPFFIIGSILILFGSGFLFVEPLCEEEKLVSPSLD